MKLYCVERWGVYQQGLFGIFDTKEKAIAALKIAKEKETDDYHCFLINEVEINTPGFFEGEFKRGEHYDTKL